jgi:2-alkenal reductase
VPGSSAEQAGLRGMEANTRALGDVIVGVNGKPVRRLADLTDELERVGVGNKVTLSVKRDGQERSVEVAVMDIGHK